MIDCVVVGGGPAGLAASAALAGQGVEHLVLERGRVGETWRTQRWDSFRLNTPGWANTVLGEQERDHYPTAAEVVRLLEKLAVGVPLREGVRVTRLVPEGSGYALHLGDGVIQARTVVIATGGENAPRVPALARALRGRVVQYHAAHYRNPDQLPDGTVLVVGSAQSGCQIAGELVGSGRPVVVATSAVGRVPIPYRGRHILEWAFDSGWFDERPRDLPDLTTLRAQPPIFAPGGRPLSLQALARAGATLAGRLIAVDNGWLRFDGSAATNMAASDEFAAQVKVMVDDYIVRAAVEAPAAEPDDTGAPVDLESPTTLDLAGIGSIIWCTGFTGEFSWLDPALLKADGKPRYSDCAGALPGIWYVGLPWLTHRGSGAFLGFPKDAAAAAAAVAARLTR